ncbi:protein of unknown function [Ruminococcaceae bacterium BL-4]|nr:protein of unknown function [Ruminococcaceae bacterium BL-4]
MKSHSKSVGLLIEISISILFFSLFCAIALQLFVHAKTMSENSVLKTKAMNCAQSVADLFRSNEDFDELIKEQYPNASILQNQIVISLDKDMQPTSSDSGTYQLTASLNEEQNETGIMKIAQISVHSESTSLCSLETKKYFSKEAAS